MYNQKKHQQAAKPILFQVQERYMFFAHIRIKLPLIEDEQLFDILFQKFEEIETKYNSFNKNSFFEQINRHAGSWVDVDETTIWLIEQIKRWNAFFMGKYAISVMPLLRAKGLHEASLLKDFIIDDQMIQTREMMVKINKNQELTTGSFIKSFAVDAAMQILKDCNITNCLINAGGSSIFVTNNNMLPFWEIELPNNNATKICINNEAFSMSNRLNKFGHEHLINPITTNWVSNEYAIAISDSCMTSDIISTALMCLDQEKDTNIIEELKKESVAFHLKEAMTHTVSHKIKWAHGSY